MSRHVNKIINMIYLMRTGEPKWLLVTSLLSFVGREEQNPPSVYSTGSVLTSRVSVLTFYVGQTALFLADQDAIFEALCSVVWFTFH